MNGLGLRKNLNTVQFIWQMKAIYTANTFSLSNFIYAHKVTSVRTKIEGKTAGA